MTTEICRHQLLGLLDEDHRNSRLNKEEACLEEDHSDGYGEPVLRVVHCDPKDWTLLNSSDTDIARDVRGKAFAPISTEMSRHKLFNMLDDAYWNAQRNAGACLEQDRSAGHSEPVLRVVYPDLEHGAFLSLSETA